jgi:hypothetical protein
MRTQTIELAALDFRAAIAAVDEVDRTVDLIFSTGADVVRSDWGTGERYMERLSLNPKHVRLDRLNSGAPLLNNHNAETLRDQIGVVVAGSAIVDGREGRASVRFSKRPDVAPLYQDVRDRIVRNVSVGYRVHRFEETRRAGDLPLRLATDWEPYEISLVPMGADAGARVRDAGAGVQTNRCVLVTALEVQTSAPGTLTAAYARVEAMPRFRDVPLLQRWRRGGGPVTDAERILLLDYHKAINRELEGVER